MKKSYSANSIFKSGSTTYYYSSLFFSSELRRHVTTLYAFVRTIDDLVDAVPQKTKEFYRLKELFYSKARKSKKTNIEVIDNFIELEKAFDFKTEWADGFWFAMECDITKHSYKNISELEEYMYGSAEVVGLMMCRLMSLPDEAFPTAQMLGKAMQYINFLRDVDEDNNLHRKYIPQDILKHYKLTDLEYKTAKEYPDRFSALMRSQVSQYYSWQQEAKVGFKYLPGRARIAIQTASDLYGWTAEKIAEEPLLVFEKKIKPSTIQILLFGLANTIRVLIKQ